MTGNRLSILGGSLLIIAIIALGWVLGVAPKLAEADAATADQHRVEAQNSAQVATLGALREQFAKLDTLRAESSAAQEAVPSAPKVEDFLNELKTAADRTGVTLSSVKAAEGAAYVAAAAPSAAATKKGASGAVPSQKAVDPTKTPGPSVGTTADAGLVGQLFTVGISISVTGAPAQVLAFTGAVQEGKRFFLVNKVSFSGTDTKSSTGTLSGYVLVVRNSTATAVRK